MLNQLLRYLRKLDQFGVIYQPKIKYSMTEYQTVFGGLVSVVLYGLSLAYLIYSLVQWGTGSLLPKITSIQEKADAQQILFRDPILQFKIRKGSDDRINPFDPSALIMIPMVLPFIDNEIPVTQYFNTNQISFSSDGGIQISNIGLQYGYSDQSEIESIIAFARCNPAFLLPDFQCASDDIKQKYFAQSSNAMIVTTFVNQFNTNKKHLETVGKEQVVAIVDDATYFQTTNLNIQESSVDTGFLFESLTGYIYATDYYLTSQQLGLSYLQKQFGYDAYVAIQLRIGKLKNFQSIQYSKISEVLADAGSIASTIFLLSFFVILCNQYLLENESLEDIIAIYYPGFKDIKIQRSLFGYIKEVTYQNKPQNISQFQQYYKRLLETAEKKLTISNQIYEISRLQFLLQNINRSKEQFQQIHKTGIRIKEFEEVKHLEEVSNLNQIVPNSQMNLSVSKLVVQEFTIDDPQPTFGLVDEDFELLLKPD